MDLFKNWIFGELALERLYAGTARN